MQYNSNASSSSSSSYWISRAKDEVGLERALCHCGIPSKLRISVKNTILAYNFSIVQTLRWANNADFFNRLILKLNKTIVAK